MVQNLNSHIILIFFLLPFLGVSQNKNWSLDECIDYAVKNNLTLKTLKYAEESGLEAYRQSYRNLLPDITGSSRYNIQYGRSIDPNNNSISSTTFFTNTYNVDASLDIFSGWKKLNTIAATKYMRKALLQETLQEKYLLAFKIMEGYYDVLYFKESLIISKMQQDISQDNYNLVKRQKELGIKAGADLYSAESELITDELKVTQANNNLKLAKLRLMQDMNLKEDMELTINDVFVLDRPEKKKDSMTPILVTSVYEKALTFIPSIKAKELRINSAQKELAVSRGALAPSFSLYAGYGTGYFETNVDDSGRVTPFKQQIEDNTSTFVGAGIRIPITERWSRRSKVKQKKIALKQAENDIALQKQGLKKIIQQLVQDNSASLLEYKKTKQQEKARKLSFEIAQKRFDNGLINYLDLNTEKNLYTTAQNQNLQVRLKLRLQEQTLAFYQGIHIFKINIGK